MRYAAAMGISRGRHAPAAPRHASELLSRMRGLLAHTERELVGWERRAEAITDPELRRQALASLRSKRFHCHGGSVFAAAAEPAHAAAVVRVIVALQTISDYLDNLSDRSPAGGEEDLRQLHRAFCDAVQPDTPVRYGEYYALHPHREDGGYLDDLVRTCREGLAALPAWTAAAGPAATLAERYVALQSLKHLTPDVREKRLRAWITEVPAPGLHWFEAAAACGSTLGLFALMAAVTRDAPADTTAVLAAYFPYPSALHILLDYLVDLEEDRRGGDFNFVACYASRAEAAERLRAIQARAAAAVAGLEDADFHRLVVAGLPAIYFADSKVQRQRLGTMATGLIARGGPAAWLFAAALRFPAWRRAP